MAKTDASGNVISRTRYEPYGLMAAGAVPTLGFTGHVNDRDTGLTYMQQRYYDPVAGRFLSIDPVVTHRNTGIGFNRYFYANNNPYRFVDPDGRWATWIHYRITYNAAKQAGYTDTAAKALAKDVVAVDKGTQSGNASDTNIHAMAGMLPDGSMQTPEEAIAATHDLIRNPNTPVERRLHAAQDGTATHHLGQVWHDPLTIKGKGLIGIVKDVLEAIEHLIKDVQISEEE